VLYVQVILRFFATLLAARSSHAMECTHASRTELLSDSRAACHPSGLAMCTQCAIRVSKVYAVRRQVPNTGAGGVQPAARPVEVQLGRRLRAVPQDPGGPGPGGRLLPADRPPGTRHPALACVHNMRCGLTVLSTDPAATRQRKLEFPLCAFPQGTGYTELGQNLHSAHRHPGKHPPR